MQMKKLTLSHVRPDAEFALTLANGIGKNFSYLFDFWLVNIVLNCNRIVLWYISDKGSLLGPQETRWVGVCSDRVLGLSRAYHYFLRTRSLIVLGPQLPRFDVSGWAFLLHQNISVQRPSAVQPSKIIRVARDLDFKSTSIS